MRLLQNGRWAARFQRQERRVLPQVMLPSQSIYVWLQAERPSLAQPGNPVLSLSKHAWSPRPALRQAHVWTAPAVQEEFGVDAKRGGKSCSRPVAAALKTA